MGKTADSRATGARPDPVRSFNRWKKKHSHKQSQKKQMRKQQKKPEWQVEREVISRLMENYEKINVNEITRFSDFPLSKKTLKGLQEAQYRLVTEIQKQTIGLALQGKDVLGAAKTGSGKTLAFLVPVLEALYRLQWTSTDGLGVLIISPTRELAYQTFEVLRKVGKNHDFSAGLIIGGKDPCTVAGPDMQPVEQTDKEVTFTNQFLENDSEALEMDSEWEGLTDSDYVFLD